MACSCAFFHFWSLKYCVMPETREDLRPQDEDGDTRAWEPGSLMVNRITIPTTDNTSLTVR